MLVIPTLGIPASGGVRHGSQIPLRLDSSRGAEASGCSRCCAPRSPTSRSRTSEPHARRDGYQVVFAADAAGSLTALGYDISLRRMEHEGNTVVTTFTVIAELAGDNPTYPR
jgi:hypothetical protein